MSTYYQYMNTAIGRLPTIEDVVEHYAQRGEPINQKPGDWKLANYKPDKTVNAPAENKKESK